MEVSAGSSVSSHVFLFFAAADCSSLNVRCAVGGPFAYEVFVNRLGCDAKTSLVHCEPKEDFGG